jgi:RimJ/RimL family protein N-acetyltransferase
MDGMGKMVYIARYQANLQNHHSTGLGKLLMGFQESVALHTPTIEKVMLTCFLNNKRGLAFYTKLGFLKDEISPEPRRLRFGKEFVPDYVILSKTVK